MPSTDDFQNVASTIASSGTATNTTRASTPGKRTSQRPAAGCALKARKKRRRMLLAREDERGVGPPRHVHLLAGLEEARQRDGQAVVGVQGQRPVEAEIDHVAHDGALEDDLAHRAAEPVAVVAALPRGRNRDLLGTDDDMHGAAHREDARGGLAAAPAHAGAAAHGDPPPTPR